MHEILDENSTARLLSRSSNLMKKKLAVDLADYDISPEQWAILTRAQAMEGSNQKNLAETSSKDRAAVTRILNILEDKGLVERKHSSCDKREFLIYLTSDGHKMYKETSVIISESLKEINSILDPAELKHMRQSLIKLISNLENFTEK
ncbi:MAG: MarR family transcriptional regulator [Methanobacterium sp. ERen5]|nr:MAG: MarR family transcriptional regulator [Methanobacterium sp. ERen5]